MRKRIIDYMNTNGISFESTSNGIKYEGYYYWGYIDISIIETEVDFNSAIKTIRNNQIH